MATMNIINCISFYLYDKICSESMHWFYQCDIIKVTQLTRKVLVMAIVHNRPIVYLFYKQHNKNA